MMIKFHIYMLMKRLYCLVVRHYTGSQTKYCLRCGKSLEEATDEQAMYNLYVELYRKTLAQQEKLTELVVVVESLQKDVQKAITNIAVLQEGTLTMTGNVNKLREAIEQQNKKIKHIEDFLAKM